MTDPSDNNKKSEQFVGRPFVAKSATPNQLGRNTLNKSIILAIRTSKIGKIANEETCKAHRGFSGTGIGLPELPNATDRKNSCQFGGNLSSQSLATFSQKIHNWRPAVAKVDLAQRLLIT